MRNGTAGWSEWGERALLFCGVIFYLFVFPHGTHGDGYVRYAAVEALATKGDWLVHKYPMIGPLVALPLYWLGFLVKHPHWWVSRFNAICFLAFLAMMFRLLRADIPDPGKRRRLALLLLVGTMYPKHVTDFYGEVFASCLAGFGLALLVIRKSLGGFAAVSLAAASSPPTLLATALSGARISWAQKRWRYVLPVALGLLLILAENLFRFGTLVNEQYFRDEALTQNALPYARLNGFHYPFFFGLLSICFSFGKGLAFYCPGLLAAPFAFRHLPERLRELEKVWLCYVVGLILIYAKWCAWPGDWYWGPRYFLFAGLPAALAIHALLEKKRSGMLESAGVLLVLTFSVWAGLNGIAFGQNNLELCGENGGYLMGFCWYVPEFSALWRPFLAERGLHGKQLAFAIYFFLTFLLLSWPIWRFLISSLKRNFLSAVNNPRETFGQWRF